MRRLRKWWSACLIGGLLVGLATAAGCSDDSKGNADNPRSSSSAALIGAWAPIRDIGSPSHDEIKLVFGSDGIWRGSDGCNKLSGRFSYEQKRFRSTPPSVQVGVLCATGVTFTEDLAKAETLSIQGDRLTFFDGAGRKVLTVKRAR